MVIKPWKVLSYFIFSLNNVHQHLGILHRVSSLDLTDAVHQRLDVGLQFFELLENCLTLEDELFRHTFRQIETLPDVGCVVNHVGSVDGLQDEVEKDILVVDLKRRKNYNLARLGHKNIPRLRKLSPIDRRWVKLGRPRWLYDKYRWHLNGKPRKDLKTQKSLIFTSLLRRNSSSGNVRCRSRNSQFFVVKSNLDILSTVFHCFACKNGVLIDFSSCGRFIWRFVKKPTFKVKLGIPRSSTNEGLQSGSPTQFPLIVFFSRNSLVQIWSLDFLCRNLLTKLECRRSN